MNAVGGDVTLAATGSENIYIDDVTASEQTVSITSAGAVEELDEDPSAEVTAATLIVEAQNGIGSLGTIETRYRKPRWKHSPAASMRRMYPIPLLPPSVISTGAGDILFSQSGGGSLAVTEARTDDGTVRLSADGGDLGVAHVLSAGAAGDLYLFCSRFGNVAVGNAVAGRHIIVTTENGAIAVEGDVESGFGGSILLSAGGDEGSMGVSGSVKSTSGHISAVSWRNLTVEGRIATGGVP